MTLVVNGVDENKRKLWWVMMRIIEEYIGRNKTMAFVEERRRGESRLGNLMVMCYKSFTKGLDGCCCVI